MGPFPGGSQASLTMQRAVVLIAVSPSRFSYFSPTFDPCVFVIN